MTPERFREWQDHWDDLQATHAAIWRAIDVKYRWMMAMVWTTVFLVPLLVTVPGLVLAWRRLWRLQRKADALAARAERWAEAAA